MKKLLALVLMASLAMTAGASAITVDGVIGTGEWDGYIATDPVGEAPQMDMSRWGMKVESGTLYWFCELGEGAVWTDFQGPFTGGWPPSAGTFPGLWIDADAKTTTYIADGGFPNCADDDNKAEWGDQGANNHRGIDVNLELGILEDWTNGAMTQPNGEGPGGACLNYWGTAGTVNNIGATSTGGAWYSNGAVLEVAVPVSEFIAAAQSSGSGAIVGDYIVAAVGVQGDDYDGPITWGYDVGTPTAIAIGSTPLLGGDATLDGAVTAGDLAILAANYGAASAASWRAGDFNRDGAVTAGDLAILAANYGSVAAPPAVTPEPATLGLLVLGVLGLLRRR